MLSSKAWRHKNLLGAKDSAQPRSAELHFHLSLLFNCLSLHLLHERHFLVVAGEAFETRLPMEVQLHDEMTDLRTT